jgi:signal transduction histidine kinase/ligand-binding sensor domain-containing protein/DNA-binding response OmpR family regulator
MRLKTLLSISLAIIAVTLSSCRKDTFAVPEEEPSKTVSTTISNHQVNCFSEDKFGHIWIGTFRGLNKYYAHDFYQYFHTSDSLSLTHDQIQSIFNDSKGRMWVCTSGGVNIYGDDDGFKRIPIASSSLNCLDIVETDGGIFLNTCNMLCKYDEAANRFNTVIADFDVDRQYSLKIACGTDGDIWAFSPFHVRRFDGKTAELKETVPTGGYLIGHYIDKTGVVWLCTFPSPSLKLYDSQSHRFIDTPAPITSHPILSKAIITAVVPYGNASLLINTQANGLFLYNTITGGIVSESEGGFPFEAPHIRITTIFTDSQNNVWFGSADQGFEVRYSYKAMFNSDSYVTSALKDKSVISVSEDSHGALWACTSHDGLYELSPDRKSIRHFDTDKIINEGVANKTYMFGSLVDSDDNIWVKTMQGIYKCRLSGDRLEVEGHLPIATTTLTEDRDGNLWLGFGTSIFRIRRGTLQVDEVPAFKKGLYIFINDIIQLKDGRIMAVAFQQNPALIDPLTLKSKELNIIDKFPGSFIIPTGLCEDSRGIIWLGTIGRGLWKYDPADSSFTNVPGSSCNDVCCVKEDSQGNIWASTQNGLCKYDRTVSRFTNYFEADGIGGNQFNERSSCRTSDGYLAFGGPHGLTFFNPLDIYFSRKFPVYFENLKVNNEFIRPYQHPEIISKTLCNNPDIHLKYYQNSFSIIYSAIDYSEYERVRYFYKLDGSDKDWVDSRMSHEAHYSNLRPGRYTFRVKVMNYDLTTEEGAAAIKIRITPPFWLAWWALLVYLALAGGIIWLIVQSRKKVRESKLEAQRLELEKEQATKTNKMNMDFFANVSHEFRNPLTMIAGPVDQMVADDSIGGQDKQLLLIVQRSVKRMLKLVNQLLDFNKLDNDTLRLQVEPTDAIPILKHTTEVFKYNADNKSIALDSTGLAGSCVVPLDSDKLDKIFGNLMGNALKFTPSGGKITVLADMVSGDDAKREFAADFASASARAWSQYLRVEVDNTGSHIASEQLEKIFERFYQIGNENKGTYNYGTGIGLYYCRRLAELHHGFIHARNLEDEPGVAFTFILPSDEEAYPTAERVPQKQSQADQFPLAAPENVSGIGTAGEISIGDDSKKTIVVVDDDTEVAHYLEVLLSPYYNVFSRFDAESALQAIREIMPDIVLSDVAMPGTDGYQLCKQIKENIEICHIPVILVTAKATVENQIEGLRTGADAYVTKPFEPAYLMALIHSQLSNREKVRSLLVTATKVETIAENVLSPTDKAFMTDLYKLMENELSNSELNISKITEMMKMSRTKFYYKVKGLTGTNPNAFFNTYRLNRAAELLKEGKYNISEIADLTGFSTLSHFSATFKKQFGVSPSEFK